MVLAVAVFVAVAVADGVESPPLMRLALAALLCLILPASAFAVGQGESALTGGPGLALAFEGGTRAGAGADVRILRGLSDSWAARLGVQATWVPATGGKGATRVAAQALGLTFAADIFKLVPFVDLGVLVADIRGGGQEARQRLGGQFGIGADYLVTSHLTLSLIGRLDYFALRLAGARGQTPVQATLALHLGHVF